MGETGSGKTGRVNAIPTPPLTHIIKDTPDTIHWMLSQAQAGARTPTDDEGNNGSTGQRGKSKPPCDLTPIDAADLEFRVLAYWAAHYGIHPKTPVWRSNGRLMGLRTDNPDVVFQVAADLVGVLGLYPEVEGMYDGRIGLWTVRERHYRLWPQLRLHLLRPIDRGRVLEVFDLDQEMLF